jgi:B12 binding domain/Radical SAM superfamily
VARILLWNAIARRRRSISDTFYDNGLATLRGYLEDRGHAIEITDWARDDFFVRLSPYCLGVILRFLYGIIFKTRYLWLKKILGISAFPIQGLLSYIQGIRLKKHLSKLISYIIKENIKIVGVKLWYGEAFTYARYFVDELNKRAPDVLTICGGYHTTLYEEHLFKSSSFDLGVACEGEVPLEAVLNICDRYDFAWDKNGALNDVVESAKKGEIENLIYREAGQIHKTPRKNLSVQSSKTIPKYTINDNKVRIHVMVESLGCDWGKCNFCVHSYFYPHFSLRSPDEIVEEIKAMLRLGIGVYRFAGSDTPPGFGVKIAQKIIDNNLKIVFGMGSRAIKGASKAYDSLVSSYTTLMNAGMRAVFMGGESGNDFINTEVMNKGVVREDIVATIAAMREAQKRTGKTLFISLALIYPPPLLGKVTLDEVYNDNIALLKDTRPDSVMITPPGPFLHTRWYDERDNFGFAVDDEIIAQAMEYEYVLYKPPHLWPHLGISLEGKSFTQILAECSILRKYVENELLIPTDISDEHFLMFYCAGIRDKDAIFKAKNETMLDIVSCNYEATKNISQRVNAFNKELSQIYISSTE